VGGIGLEPEFEKHGKETIQLISLYIQPAEILLEGLRKEGLEFEDQQGRKPEYRLNHCD
jgi:hypothetical protein